MADELAEDTETIKTTNSESVEANKAKLNDDQENVGEERTGLYNEVQKDDEHTHAEHMEGEHLEKEYLQGEQPEEEHVEEDHVEGEHEVSEELKGEQKESKECEEMLVLEGEGLEGNKVELGEMKAEARVEEIAEEEEAYVEEPPPDPTAPFNFSDSTEALKEPFQLRPEQLAEVEQLWEYYQNYTPAYTDIDNYITDKELMYMLKALLLMTVTEEQFYELIDYCVRPPHPNGHINFDQFVKMVTIRQRDTAIEDELRSALQVLDPENTGSVDRENLKELLAKQGYKMSQKHLDNLIKEVDLSNDGNLGIEDIIGTMCIDLNKEDLQLLMASIYPPDGSSPRAQEE